MEDYNYPIVQFYRYKQVAHLKGAEKTGEMTVEYAVVLRVEFIPEGSATGPVKDIYFKIFKRGTCGIVGAVFGWPTLDAPSLPGGEGLGRTNRTDGAEYKALRVTLPRLDESRKIGYMASAARYSISKGQLIAIDESRDEVHLINVEGARMLRAASIIARETPRRPDGISRNRILHLTTRRTGSSSSAMEQTREGKDYRVLYAPRSP
jgi:hypothetical protein